MSRRTLLSLLEGPCKTSLWGRCQALAGLLAVASLSMTLAMILSGCAARRGGQAGNAGEDGDEDGDASEAEPWLKRRVLPTVLTKRGPAPAKTASLALPPGMERVRYPSTAREGELSLLAVIAAPRLAPETPASLQERLPAVLLLHSGFALTEEHLAWAAPFVDAGFLVMLPSWRGENGNDGAFELVAGEVDDAKAAGRWLASQPDVDVDRLSVFGHAEGGAVAAMLALDPDVPFRRIAVSSGVTTSSSLLRWQREDKLALPFDAALPLELKRRALLPNAHELVQPLVLYLGDDDALGLRDARRVKERAAALVEVVPVPGDRRSSVTPALQRFLALVVADAGRAPLATTWRPAASSRFAP